MGFTRVCNNVADAKFGGRRFNVNNHHHENRRHYNNNKRAQAREYVEEYPQYTQCVQEYPAQECFYSPAPEYFVHQECNYSSAPRCCHECRDVQVKRAEQDWRKGNKNSGPARRDVTRIQRQPGQAEPGTISPPAQFHHTPYAVCEQVDSKTTDAAVEEYLKFKAPSADPLCYDMPPCQAPSVEPTPVLSHTHEESVYHQPKNRILCLRWVNGTCGEKRKNAPAEEQEEPVVCAYAHPDLSEVPPGVCPTYWFTGFCRFDRRDQSQVEPEDESLEFGLHGWTHYKRLENNISDDSSNDGEKKKNNNSRRRPPSVCYSCHHAPPVGGFPLLPGISCKTTVLEREAALALYPKWY